jgi:dTDP-4-dehydrorhamnose reductase
MINHSLSISELDFSNLDNKTFLITGANGMLGRAYEQIIRRYLPFAKLYSFGKDKLNVVDKSQTLNYAYLKPDFIIHCAALVNADYCENNENEAYNVIVQGTQNIVELAIKCNAKILYPQSFLIFDGIENPITERTIPTPLSVYGKYKLIAEQIILDNTSNSLIVRMGGFFGGNEVDKNFVGKIIPQISLKIKNGEKSMEIGNRIWQPTYTNDLALNTLLLLANTKSGIYVMASHGQASFFELTSLIIEKLNLQSIFKIIEIDSSKLNNIEIAKRPKIAIFENARLNHENLDIQRSWQESLTEYINNNYYKNLFI